MLDFYKIIDNIKNKSPVVHCITNYVTANDCANLLLACGASPVMADSPVESAQFTDRSDALLLNMGTIKPEAAEAMVQSGKQANLSGKPVIFDPVGVGSSDFRMKTAKKLLDSVKFTLIRANMSEVKTLLDFSLRTSGVDACFSDKTTAENIIQNINIVKTLCKKTGATVVASGEYDLVSDGNCAYIIKNGHPMMSRITGSGCMLSALCAAFIAANTDQPLSAAAAAVCCFGICGELAYFTNIGNASYKINLIDEIYRLDPKIAKERAKYELSL